MAPGVPVCVATLAVVQEGREDDWACRRALGQQRTVHRQLTVRATAGCSAASGLDNETGRQGERDACGNQHTVRAAVATGLVLNDIEQPSEGPGPVLRDGAREANGIVRVTAAGIGVQAGRQLVSKHLAAHRPLLVNVLLAMVGAMAWAIFDTTE